MLLTCPPKTARDGLWFSWRDDYSRIVGDTFYSAYNTRPQEGAPNDRNTSFHPLQHVIRAIANEPVTYTISGLQSSSFFVYNLFIDVEQLQVDAP